MRKALALAVLAATVGLSGAAFAGDEAVVAKRTQTWEWKAPFATMSPEGVAIIGEAMKRDRIPANAAEVRKARQKVLQLLDAERLDVAALRKAQAEERAIAIKEHAVHQEKLLKAYERLSLEDRRAFVAGMRMQEERMMKHMERARARMLQVQEQMRRDREQMRRELEMRVKKETGSLWIVVPPAAPVPAAPVAPPESPARG